MQAMSLMYDGILGATGHSLVLGRHRGNWKIVIPIAHEFNPDLVIISAGFDAAAIDKLGPALPRPVAVPT